MASETTSHEEAAYIEEIVFDVPNNVEVVVVYRRGRDQFVGDTCDEFYHY